MNHQRVFWNISKKIFWKIWRKFEWKYIECLENRFNQNGLEYYEALQQILILAASKKNYDKELEKILEFYNNKRSNDFYEKNLLKSFQKNIQNVKAFLQYRSEINAYSLSAAFTRNDFYDWLCKILYFCLGWVEILMTPLTLVLDVKLVTIFKIF